MPVVRAADAAGVLCRKCSGNGDWRWKYDTVTVGGRVAEPCVRSAVVWCGSSEKPGKPEIFECVGHAGWAGIERRLRGRRKWQNIGCSAGQSFSAGVFRRGLPPARSLLRARGGNRCARLGIRLWQRPVRRRSLDVLRFRCSIRHSELCRQHR